MSKKIRKNRGNKTGYGHKKKHRGAGSRGGRGKAGLQKHKRSLTENSSSVSFEKSKMKSVSKKLNVINLNQLNDNVLKNSLKEVTLKGYKVLGKGNLTQKLKISADAFSKSALDKINSSGGTAEIIGKSKKETKESAEHKNTSQEKKSKK